MASTDPPASEGEPRSERQSPSEASDDGVSPENAPLPPGPNGLPVVGSTFRATRDGVAFAESLGKYGDVVSYDAFGTTFVAVSRPDLLEAVLVSRNDEFWKGEYERAFGELIAPEGLAFTEGERWRRQRTLLQSTFTPDRVRSYGDVMVDLAAATADRWADGEVVRADEAFASLTLRILTRTLFDVDLGGERGRAVRDFAAALREYVDAMGVNTLLPEWVPTPSRRRHDRATAALDDLVETLIAERDGTGDDLLSTLVDAEFPDGTTMDHDTVRDQLVTFLFAGHETTATALTYACWLLAGRDDVRKRLDAELDAVLGDRDPTVADLPELEYLDSVVRETLRLYPPVYAVYREPRETTTLGGYRIPADATLQLSIYGVHRDERWWDDPESFRPGRWTDDGSDADAAGGSDSRPEYAFCPFGGGPRHCIGMRFATMELKLAMATLARRVEFDRVTETVDPEMNVTLDPGEVRLRARKRR
ncbi:cytochrome P450 [Halostella sp. JP-L12]|uniref:cytochrome P450 n=1 Tax=Halostella TaxID=1843185 RepID=UPI000EF7CEA8|nr:MULTISPECIES: cytochrome P450 [Halostella]NHN48485.1 cytochrome P450 [Halostella sp. JP-L12]